MQPPTPSDPSSEIRPATPPLWESPRWEWLGIAILFLAVGFMLFVSWRKWTDPVVDFGRELYLPWRLSEGAVLYRDIDHLYGPLSHYLNALVFRAFGPGLMKLVTVNLLVYGAILGLVYWEVRTAWGRLAAFAGAFFFVMLFSFCQFVGIANYNFATPYSHETTHGFLLVLGLIALWASWLREPRLGKAVAAGLCCGLSVLLKAEILIAAAAVTTCALLRAAITRPDLRSWKAAGPQAAAFLAAGFAPVLVATAWLAATAHVSLGNAFAWANNAWLSLLQYSHITQEPTQRLFLGTANLSGNLSAIFLYGVLSVAAAFALASLCNQNEEKLSWTQLVLVLAAALLALAVPWMELGKIFPAWLAVAAVAAFWRRSSLSAASANMQWLLIFAAAAFLVRMAFNPRFFHYGYYQGALAGIVCVAVAFRAVPDLMGLRNRSIYVIVLAVFGLQGLRLLETHSLRFYRNKTVRIGEGSDAFYGFGANVDPAPGFLEDARQKLAAMPEHRTLLTIPEGVMLNYLTRKPTVVPQFMFVPSLLQEPMRERLMRQLKATPPDGVVIVSRDLREFGVDRFGESPDHGQDIMTWIDWNYRVASQFGGDPLDTGLRGVVIYARGDEDRQTAVPAE